MLELQPVSLLVIALGSRLAVASKHLTLRLQHVAEDPATESGSKKRNYGAWLLVNMATTEDSG